MGANCPHCSKEVTGWIPEDRLSKMAADKREALAQLEALKTEAAGFKTKAEAVETLTAELTEATGSQTLRMLLTCLPSMSAEHLRALPLLTGWAIRTHSPGLCLLCLAVLHRHRHP